MYISGAVLANDLGLPDIGLTTLTEVATRAGQIARMTDLPAIVDADTGFGEPMNVARSVQELENAGLAGYIEDQFNPNAAGTWTARTWWTSTPPRKASALRPMPGGTRTS